MRITLSVVTLTALCFTSLFGKDPSREQSAVAQHLIYSETASSSWGKYGVSPESPNGKRLCFAVYPENLILKRVRPWYLLTRYTAELWVANLDGSDARKLFTSISTIHDGLGQAWVDDEHIVCHGYHEGSAVYVVNTNSGDVVRRFLRHGMGHYPVDGKIALTRKLRPETSEDAALYEYDTNTGALRLVREFSSSLNHVQYSPSGKRILFTMNNNTNLGMVNSNGSGFVELEGDKPMHFQWYDEDSIFGYTLKGIVGYDPRKHHEKELYRWNLKGEITEYLAGYGCHCAASADRNFFAGESWYESENIALRLYKRGERKALRTVFVHSFKDVVWKPRSHVNPSFSPNGNRLYFNKAVDRDTTKAFYHELNASRSDKSNPTRKSR